MLSMLCERLDKEGIGYSKETLLDGTEFIYIHHGAFGYPDGVKIKKRKFRPDFRISYHEGHGYYTKVCGYTSYMNVKEIIRTAKEWGQ